MSPPINIDGAQVSGITIDGGDVSAVTVDGTTVFSASAIEYWEDGDQQAWTVNAGSLSVNNNSPVYQGGISGKVTKDGGGIAEVTSLPGDGLNNYPDQYGTHQFRFSVDTVAEFGLEYRFAVQSQSLDNCYMARWRTDNDQITLNKFTGGSFSSLSSSSFSGSAGTEYIGEIQHSSNGDIVWTVKDASGTDLASTSANDTEHAPNGLSLNPNSDGGAITTTFDEMNVTSTE